MDINISGAKYSDIIQIGKNLKIKSRQSGTDYLYLNRGINQVVNIDLSEIVKGIDFNSSEIQYYPPNSGHVKLKKAVNEKFFMNYADEENIFITSGATNALTLIFQTLKLKQVYTPEYYWGSYSNILNISNKEQSFYPNFDDLCENPHKYKGSAVIICDPNNPLGSKVKDEKLLKTVKTLNEKNILVVWDGPYRKLFYNDKDELYKKLLEFDNVILIESFSKSIGISGQRVGFIHCKNEKFNNEFNIRLLYNGNGVNSFAQILSEKVLNTPEGNKAGKDFKEKTVRDIAININYLKDKHLLAEEFYKDSIPMGIFVVVNKSFDQLMKYNIGSVPLHYFTLKDDINIEKYSRICVSVPSAKFMEFFSKIK